MGCVRDSAQHCPATLPPGRSRPNAGSTSRPAGPAGSSVPGLPRPAGARGHGAGTPGKLLGPYDVGVPRVQRKRLKPPVVRAMPLGDPELLHGGPLRTGARPRAHLVSGGPATHTRIAAGPPGVIRRLADNASLICRR